MLFFVILFESTCVDLYRNTVPIFFVSNSIFCFEIKHIASYNHQSHALLLLKAIKLFPWLLYTVASQWLLVMVMCTDMSTQRSADDTLRKPNKDASLNGCSSVDFIKGLQQLRKVSWVLLLFLQFIIAHCFFAELFVFRISWKKCRFSIIRRLILYSQGVLK